MYLPSFFLSSTAMLAPCKPGPHTTSSCQRNNWFPPTWWTPPDGVLVMWAQAEYPGSGVSLDVLPGHDATIDRHPARLYVGGATSACPPGSDTEVSAWVQAYGRQQAGRRWDMRACLGPSVTHAARAAVRTMVTTMHVNPSS